MTTAEGVFIFITTIVLLILSICIKNINWEKLGFKPKVVLNGWWQILLFNAGIFFLVQVAITNKLVSFPDWMLDKDPLLPLIAITFLQEVLFRGLIISQLERFGKQRALWISVAIFVGFHLVAPYTWTSVGLMFAGFTFFAGYFWGWHFLKFRNIYMLGVSHFLVNLSFNYIILNLIFE